MLRRVLRSIAELGIKRLCLVNAARVEKSYWQSPLLRGAALRHYLVAGLEQACDTVLPEVVSHPRLRPFVEDELPAISKGCERLLAHPAATEPGRAAPAERLRWRMWDRKGDPLISRSRCSAAPVPAHSRWGRVSCGWKPRCRPFAATLFPAQ